MNYLIFRDFSEFFQNFVSSLNLKSIYLIKFNFINHVGDVEKSGASDQIVISDPSRG